MGRATLAPSATTPTGAGETREARGRAPSGRVASGRVAGDRVASDRVAGDRVASDRVPPSSEPAAERSGQPAPQGGAPFGEGVRVMRLAAPFLDVTARIAVDDDGAPTGDVDLTGDVGLAGMPVATLRWAVAGWDGAGDLVLPTVTADAATLRVTPPPGVGLAVARASVSEAAAPVSGPAASVSESAVGGPSGAGVVDEVIVLPLPSLARAGAPAGPAGALERLPGAIAEVLGALLGADLSRLFLDAGPGAVAATRVAGAPAVVSGDVVRLAPGAPAPTEPDGARLLDAAARLWLADVEGPVEVGGRLPNPTPVVEQPAPPAPAPLPAERGVVRPIGADSTNNRAFGAEEAGGAEEPAGAAPPAAEPPAEEGAGVDLLMPSAPTEPGPEQQARAGGVARAARAASSSAAAMPSAAATVGEARGAVTEPDAETTARAAADLAERLGERAAPSPEIVALAERIRTAIRQRRPVDEDQLTSANPESAAREAGASVTSSVEGDAARVQGSYAELATPPAGEPALTPTPVQPQNPAVSDPGINAGAAAPDAIPPENLSLEADRQNVEQRASDARIERHSTEPLQGQEPFSTVRDGRAELGGMAQTGPAEVAAQQEQAIAAAQADMHALQAQALAALNSSRGGTVAAVATGQGGMVGSEQQTRESVSRQAQGIFDGARTQVEALLNPLSRTALARWDAGVTRLSTQFREHLARVQRWIDERHSGIGGAIVGAWDAVTGLPGWVTREYDDAERAFGDGVAALLLGISADVNTVIAAAEAVIDAARTRIRDLFASLPAELQEWAAGEQARFEGQLDGLAARAAQTRTSFVTDVSQRATQAVSEVQAEVERLRTAARGLIGRIADAIGAFLDDPVRAIIDGLLSLVGIPPASFWALVDRISQVISDIADDPETFINNLVAGLRQGFQQFFDRFGTHVLNGFWAWLFSGLGSVGVQIPSDFSVRSLVTFVLQVMGITWPRIREILVRHIGAENVELIEKVWELVSTLIQRGPEGLVEMIRERLDPATIVQTILRAAVEYLVERLIQAVVMRVLGMLNPVGAVLQAIELIYRVLRWVFENAARIFALVETVVNGVADVMAGRIGQMAGAIERALAGLIPPVIDFLAGLLGLGDLPEQIAAVIGRLQTMVLGVVERILVALITRGRALLASLGLGGGADDGARPGAEGEADTELGTTVRFTAAGESHRQWIGVSGENAVPMVASTPMPVADKLTQWEGKVAADEPADDAARAEARGLLPQARTLHGGVDSEADTVARAFLAARSTPDSPPPSDDAVERRQQALGQALARLFTLFGEQGSDEAYAADVAANLPGHGREFATTVHGEWWRLQVSKVKVVPPAPGGPEDLWTVATLPGSEGPAIALLGQSDIHHRLLPYFRAPGGGATRRTAGAQAFGSYALRTENPDPTHDVRRRFLDVLGATAAARLKDAGATRLSGDVNSALLDAVRAIGYDSNDGRYGAFSPWPQDEVNPHLRAAVAEAGGVVEFLRRMVRDGQAGAVTWEHFTTLWAGGGPTMNWFKDRFRAVAPASHEWIPTDWIPAVVDHAISLARADRGELRKALQWIDVHNLLRSPTNYVLYRMTTTVFHAPARGPARAESTLDPTGHVGAFSEDPEGRRGAGTAGSQAFHDWLRAIFDTHKGLGPANFVRYLRSQLPTQVWDGNLARVPEAALDRPIGMYYRTDAGIDGSLTVRRLGAIQVGNYQAILADFQSVLAALSSGV